jgi:diacylglycerol O-acyltransferase
MVPMATRLPNEKEGGNHLGAMLVSLPVQESDPVKVIEFETEHSKAEKLYSRALSFEKLMDFIPAGLAEMVTNLSVNSMKPKVEKQSSPAYNLCITNVPGPQMPLYAHGAKLIRTYPMAPLIHGQGILLAIFSYDGNIYLGATADKALFPDLDKLIKYYLESFEELNKLI